DTARELASALGYQPRAQAGRKERTGGTESPQAQDVEIAFLMEDLIVASTIDRADRGSIEPLLKRRGREEQIDLRWRGVPYVAFVSPLTRGGTSAYQVILISQRSLQELLATLRQGALVCGLLTMTVCIGISS